jgi:hypothetical protein
MPGAGTPKHENEAVQEDELEIINNQQSIIN